MKILLKQSLQFMPLHIYFVCAVTFLFLIPGNFCLLQDYLTHKIHQTETLDLQYEDCVCSHKIQNNENSFSQTLFVLKATKPVQISVTVLFYLPQPENTMLYMCISVTDDIIFCAHKVQVRKIFVAYCFSTTDVHVVLSV